jgi:uncharacterized protein
MKIAVLSDTHMPKRARLLPQQLLDGIKGVDLILHAGDWTSLEIYEELLKVAPVEGVFGNVDPIEVKEFFPDKKIIALHGYKIGLVHGHSGKRKTTPDRAIEAFQNDHVDLIIFGHSHIPIKKQVENTLLFNPGSPTDKRFQRQFSYGIIELGQSITADHYFFSK